MYKFFQVYYRGKKPRQSYCKPLPRILPPPSCVRFLDFLSGFLERAKVVFAAVWWRQMLSLLWWRQMSSLLWWRQMLSLLWWRQMLPFWMWRSMSSLLRKGQMSFFMVKTNVVLATVNSNFVFAVVKANVVFVIVRANVVFALMKACPWSCTACSPSDQSRDDRWSSGCKNWTTSSVPTMHLANKTNLGY